MIDSKCNRGCEIFKAHTFLCGLVKANNFLMLDRKPLLSGVVN